MNNTYIKDFYEDYDLILTHALAREQLHALCRAY